MRRPRSKLQVSTFPFLAVLLCAMGSLLLFLFIMDRRAKIVAQHRAQEAKKEWVARQPDTPAQQDTRQAEWEAVREKLRRWLVEQQQQVLGEAQVVQQNLADTSNKLGLVQTRLLDTQEQVSSEAGKILAMQEMLEQQRKHIQATSQKETASKTELAKANQELLELTAALEVLRAQRQHSDQVYSVVPYRGKRGDERRPIYVECSREGLLFHPDKKLIYALEFSPATLIAEVERRTGAALVVEKATKDKGLRLVEERKGPYVLFLVRPEGIGNYYKAQGTLRGFQLDFGYELVDENWVLDFTGEANGKQKPLLPRLTTTVAPAPPETITGPTFPGFGNATGGATGQQAGFPPLGPPGLPGVQGLGSGPGGSGPGGSGPGGSGPGGSGPGSGLPGGIGLPPLPGSLPGGSSGSGIPGVGSGGPGAGPGNVNAGAGMGLLSPLGGVPGVRPGIGTSGGVGNAGAGMGFPSPVAGVPGIGLGNGNVGAGQGFPSPVGGVPGVVQGNAVPGSGPALPGFPTGGTPSRDPSFVPLPQGLAQLANGPAGSRPMAIASAGGPGTTGGAPTQPGQGSPGNPGAANTPNAGNSAGMQGSNPNATPGYPGTASGVAGGSAGGVSGAPSAGAPGGAAGGPSGSASAGPVFNRAPLPPGFGSEKPSRPPAPSSLSRILGNKDFLITIDCFAEHVNVFPGGMQFRWTAQNMQATNQALVQSVAKLIERRQASVRPGEPSYRPIIRFQVSTEGLRSFYHVYPLLEPLRVPMTRENVED